jgi:hypothetical protein
MEDLRKALALVVPQQDQESVLRWSGERESNLMAVVRNSLSQLP